MQFFLLRREIDELICAMRSRRVEIDLLEDQRIEREREFSELQEKKLEMKRQKISMKLRNERIKAEKLALETAKNEAITRAQFTKSAIDTAQNNVNSLKDEQIKLTGKLESLESDYITDNFCKISSKIDWELYRTIESHLSTSLGEERMILRTLQRKLEGEKRELKSATNTLQGEVKKLNEFTDKSGKLEMLFNELQLRVTKIECEMTTSQKTLQLTTSKIEVIIYLF